MEQYSTCHSCQNAHRPIRVKTSAKNHADVVHRGYYENSINMFGAKIIDQQSSL